MESSIPQSTSSTSISALVPSSNTSSTTFSLEPFRAYLAQIVPLLLGADGGNELDTMWDAGADEDAVGERVRKWAADPSAGVVYVVKSRDARDERGTYTIPMSLTERAG